MDALGGLLEYRLGTEVLQLLGHLAGRHGLELLLGKTDLPRLGHRDRWRHWHTRRSDRPPTSGELLLPCFFFAKAGRSALDIEPVGHRSLEFRHFRGETEGRVPDVGAQEVTGTATQSIAEELIFSLLAPVTAYRDIDVTLVHNRL